MAITQFIRALQAHSVGPEHGYVDLPGPTSLAGLAALYHKHGLVMPLAVDTSTLFARIRTGPVVEPGTSNLLVTLLAGVTGPVLLVVS